MKKLKLDLDQIQVSSFVAQEGSGHEGTVHAASITDSPDCGPTQMWDSCYSCYPQHCQPQPISWDTNC
jgi:hypothetical protein